MNYLRENELLDHVPYWKLAQALFEVLPRDEEDWKLISRQDIHGGVLSFSFRRKA
jgi:hypothetical protein